MELQAGAILKALCVGVFKDTLTSKTSQPLLRTVLLQEQYYSLTLTNVKIFYELVSNNVVCKVYGHIVWFFKFY